MAKQTTQKQHNQKGAAMVVVLCIMAVLLVLSLSILLSGASLVGSARKNRLATNCRVMAESFQDLLDDGIVGADKSMEVDQFPDKAGDGVSLAYYAMRSLRTQQEKGGAAADNNLLSLLDKEEEYSKEPHRVFYGGGDIYNESGYQLELEIYLRADKNELNDANSLIQSTYGPGAPGPHEGSEYTGRFLEYYMPLMYTEPQAGVRLYSHLTCSNGKEQYTIDSSYQVKLTADLETNVFTPQSDGSYIEENPPKITWRWEKDRVYEE